MKPSARGLAFIQRWEDCHLTAYPDPGTGGEPWTIGWGSTRYPDGASVRPGDLITQEQADAMFAADVAKFAAAVNEAVDVPLTQAQFDALVSLAYNIGATAFARSTLVRKLNAGDFAGAAAEFDRWNKSRGRVLNGLTNRRAAERAMFEEKPMSMNEQLRQKLTDAEYAALMGWLDAEAGRRAKERAFAAVKGAGKSWTVRLNALAGAIALAWPQIEPHVAALLGADAVANLIALYAALNIALRAKTDKPLAER